MYETIQVGDRIRIEHSPIPIERKDQSSRREWFAFVDGKMLRRTNGVGRAFKTMEAAKKAALKEMGSNRIGTV